MSWASALTEGGVGGNATPDFRQCRGKRAVGSLEAAHLDGGEGPMHRHGWWQALLVLACVLLTGLISGAQWSFLQILLVVPAYLMGRRWAAVQPALLGFGLGIVGQLVIWFRGEPADYLAQWFTSVLSDFVLLLMPWRSEERRVGKECGAWLGWCGWWRR